MLALNRGGNDMVFGSGTFDLEQDKRYAALPKIIAPEEPVAVRPFYLGLPQWGVKEWKGDLYPPSLAAKDFLSFYARYFNCVELSSTFYAHVSDEQIANWRAQVGADFKFLPKWPKVMTHNKMLLDCAAELK